MVSRAGSPPGHRSERRRSASRHRLRSELRRYLIVFEPPTFALDRGKRACHTPSLQCVLRRSKNFTSNVAIRVAPIAPFDHCLVVNGDRRMTRGRGHFPSFHAFRMQAGGARSEHSNFFTVNVPAASDTRRRAPSEEPCGPKRPGGGRARTATRVERRRRPTTPLPRRSRARRRTDER